ncbi:hypothetical protein [Acidovorax sp. A1169]|uniref:hypothetical protein n=1 Tax=Acidovorax sp. A1169 TaxID=3059524 RepID=UPI002737C9C4|nr:hypothetical protein [Acidovorax sp. A1169]MDP4076268.1 hypothetical protein [Acidovorax sp. A1169]
MRKLVIVAACVFAVSGCVQAPSIQPVAAMRSPLPTTPAPSDAEALAALQAQLERTLKDPDSIKQFRLLTSPTWATWRGTGNWVHAIDGGWLVCYELNAKNSYGVYVGMRTQGVVFHVNAGRLIPIKEVEWGSIEPTCPVQG